MTQSIDPLDLPWEDVTITLVYRDGNKNVELKFPANRAEIEVEERAARVRSASQGQDPQDPVVAEAIAAATAWRLSPGEFQHRIIENAKGLIRTPLTLPGKYAHTFRMLPVHAIQGLLVEVHNVKSAIIVPGSA